MNLSQIPKTIEKQNLEIRDILQAQEVNKILNEDVLRDRIKANTNLRISVAIWTGIVVSLWLWKVSDIMVKNNEFYCLSDSVLITLLTTTTFNVLGLVTIVLYDLFNGKSEN